MQRKYCTAKKAEHDKMKHGRSTVRRENHASDISNAFVTSMDTREEEEEKNIILKLNCKGWNYICSDISTVTKLVTWRDKKSLLMSS